MTRTIVYVACADSHEIAVLRLDPASGALVPVQQVVDRRRRHAAGA